MALCPLTDFCSDVVDMLTFWSLAECNLQEVLKRNSIPMEAFGPIHLVIFSTEDFVYIFLL